jgi:hypothetical protein
LELLGAFPAGLPGHSIRREYVARFGSSLESDLGPDTALRVSTVMARLGPGVVVESVNTQPVYRLPSKFKADM